jgi:hypothetical protein
MRGFPRRATILLAVAGGLSGAAAADVLVLKDGRRVEGAVVEQGVAYEVRTAGGTVTVKKEEVKEWTKAPVPTSPGKASAAADPEKAAADLFDAAEKAIARKSYAEAKGMLERIEKQHPMTSVAPRAVELLATMPNALGRLVLGLDKPASAQAYRVNETGQVQPVRVGSGGVLVEAVSDPKQVKHGSGAAHVVIDSARGATLVYFPIPEQSLEKLRTVSLWMWSEARLHQKRVVKLCLVSPSTAGTLNFLDANVVGADDNGWKLVQVQRGQFKGEGGGFAADFQNGRPSWKKVCGIGFLVPVENFRDFILDDVRVLE